MGQHYFDRPAHAYVQPNQRPVGLGENPNPLLRTDYTNYYGTWAVETAIAYDEPTSPNTPPTASTRRWPSTWAASACART